MGKAFRFTSVKLDGRQPEKQSLIKQLAKYRVLMRIERAHIALSSDCFGSPGHVYQLENMKQRENSIQVAEYARALGLKEIKIII